MRTVVWQGLGERTPIHLDLIVLLCLTEHFFRQVLLQTLAYHIVLWKSQSMWFCFKNLYQVNTIASLSLQRMKSVVNVVST